MVLSLRTEVLIERLAAFLAFACLLVVYLLPSKPRLEPENLGDFKLVYASARSLAETGDAYSFEGMARAHRENGVIVPPTWYGHSPIYPPFTLLFLTPLLTLPMIPAAYLWAVLGYVALAFAAAALARYGAFAFNLPIALRVLIVCLMAASPLVSFGIELANLSVVASCLCILAVTTPPERSIWVNALALAVALMLKPHLAFWVVLALLLPSSRGRGSERTLALRASFVFVALLVAMGAYLAARHQLVSLIQSYLHVLRLEASGGSMDVRARQIMMMPAHITSLGSLLGYWLDSHTTILRVQLLLLAPLLAFLLWATRHTAPSLTTIAVGAWITFGMLLTYHRAHDGIVLFLLLPWALARVWQRWYDPAGWSVLAFYTLFSVDAPQGFYAWLSSKPSFHELAELFTYRQGALAMVALALTLVSLLLRSAVLRSRASSQTSTVMPSQQ